MAKKKATKPGPSNTKPKHTGRGITRQPKMIISASELAKHHIQFDDVGRCIGENSSPFSSTVGVLTRMHCRIGFSSWKKVPQADKDAFWGALIAMWDVPPTKAKKNENLRKTNNLWRKWKVDLAKKYVLGGKYSGWKKKFVPEEFRNPLPEVEQEDEGETAGEDNVDGGEENVDGGEENVDAGEENVDAEEENAEAGQELVKLSESSTDEKKTIFDVFQWVKKDDWDEFVKIRTEPGYAAKSQRGVENQKKNKYPHYFSRSGYRIANEELQKKLDSAFEEKKKTDPNAKRTEEYTMSRDKAWKFIRQKPDGTFKNEETAQAAKKMDELLADPEFDREKYDIILSSTGNNDFHNGRVVGERGELGKTKVFGKEIRRKREKNADRDKRLDELERMIKEVRESQQSQPQQGLHSQQADHSLDISRGVPRHRAQSYEEVGDVEIMDYLREWANNRLAQEQLAMPDFPYIHTRHPDLYYGSFIMYDDFMCMINRGSWLAVGHLNVWASYLQQFVNNNHDEDKYCLLDPTGICVEEDDRASAYRNLVLYLKRIQDKQFYICPFLADGHFQLFVLSPWTNEIILFCSLRPRILMWQLEHFTNALYESGLLKDRKQPPILRKPKSYKQKSTWECGYYVMKWMQEIILGRVQCNWVLEFCEKGRSLSNTDIDHLRTLWGTYYAETLNLE